MIKKLALIIGFIICLSSCGKDYVYRIEGELSNLEDQTVYAVFEKDNYKGDRRAGSYADKKAYKQVDDRARRAHSRQRLGADKLTDNDRVNRVIQLLKKSADQDRKEEKQKLFPNNTFRDPVFCFFQTSSPFDTL